MISEGLVCKRELKCKQFKRMLKVREYLKDTSVCLPILTLKKWLGEDLKRLISLVSLIKVQLGSASLSTPFLITAIICKILHISIICHIFNWI